MTYDARVGDTGTSIRILIQNQDNEIVDVGDATEMVIIFVKPDGSRVEKTASLLTDGSDGYIHYVTEADFLDQSGTWKYEGRVGFPDGDEWTTKETFKLKVGEVL